MNGKPAWGGLAKCNPPHDNEQYAIAQGAIERAYVSHAEKKQSSKNVDNQEMT
ncbi:MAG: hypothetical protein DID90_2727553176 [Candidatus Nitrotoga sp. LAW]|nr:MAG: hypothetical protein DID90_2727553176 [Candidatus Nitrotoga sp. LAW]